MKRFSMLLLLGAMVVTGCARPGEVGWSTAYNRTELDRQIVRNWDWDGKQMVDDIDHTLLLRPMGHLTIWDLR
jgi:hypothetical protein